MCCMRLHNIQWWEFPLCLLAKEGAKAPHCFLWESARHYYICLRNLELYQIVWSLGFKEGKLSLIIIMYVQLWVAIIKLWIISCPGNTWSLFMYGQEIVLMDTHEVHYAMYNTSSRWPGFAHLEGAHVFFKNIYYAVSHHLTTYPKNMFSVCNFTSGIYWVGVVLFILSLTLLHFAVKFSVSLKYVL